MTPQDFRSALDALGLHITAAAQALGISRRSAQRYASKGAPEHIRLALEGLKAQRERAQ